MCWSTSRTVVGHQSADAAFRIPELCQRDPALLRVEELDELAHGLVGKLLQEGGTVVGGQLVE
jgi:hypothetical protein